MQLLPAFVVKDIYYYILNAEPMEIDAARGAVNFGMQICGTNNPDLNKDGVPKLSAELIANLETNTIADKLHIVVDERKYAGAWNGANMKTVNNYRYGQPRLTDNGELMVNTLTFSMLRNHTYGERYINTNDNFSEKSTLGYSIPVTNGENLTNAYYHNGNFKVREKNQTLGDLLKEIEVLYPGFTAKVNALLNEDAI